MTNPTQLLKDEHQIILRALDVLEAAAGRLSAGEPPVENGWAGLIAWLRGFADRTHHAKEETLLFPALVSAGVPNEGGPVGVMLEEHAQGRRLIAAMDAAAPEPRAAAAQAYVRLLRAHIDKENEILFPLADEVLDEATLRTLGREFDRVGTEIGCEASLDHAGAALDGIAAELSGRSAPTSTTARA